MKKAFILGNPRSGTSLLRLMLNAHPLIVSPPESGFLQWWYQKYKHWTSEDSRSVSSVEQYVVDLLSSKKMETWNLEKGELINLITKDCPPNYDKLSESAYKLYAIKNGVNPSVIVDKNNYYINHLTDLNQIWPEAYYIYIIRDGRDVACSYIDLADVRSDSPYKPSLSQEIESIAREWNKNNLNVYNFLSNKKGLNWLMIRYEDLVQRPSECLERLMDFVDIGFSDRMLEYYLYNDEPAQTMDWKIKTLSKPDPSSIGRYLRQLSPNEITKFEEIAAESLSLGNYRLNNSYS